MKLVEKIYGITKSFPKAEIYGLASQMQRSAVSIPSNISEGFRRNHRREYKQYLGIALGSCGELETQIEISYRCGYIIEQIKNELIADVEYLCKMMQTLIRKL
ncbi:MAG: four helix bundle protein [Candidatus Omnitrophica bacterium]|nr:four helix bundle protein [Candidatus Omnitrophota bacterium]